MRWSALSPRERRVILLGALAVGAALFIRAVGLPYLQVVGDAEARLARERSLLEREQHLLADMGLYARAFEDVAGQFLEAAPRLLAGDTHASAQATLARAIEQAAASGSIRLSQVEPLPIQPAGEGIVALSIRVQGESDLEGMLTLLAALEAGPMLFRVQDLEVETGNRVESQSPEIPDAPEALRFQFTVVGYVLTGDIDTRESNRGSNVEPPAAGNEGVRRPAR